MPITVGFDATSAARQSAGIGRYTRSLLTALNAAHDDTRFKLFYWAAGALDGAMPLLGERFRVRPLPVSDRVANAAWHRIRLPLPVQAVLGGFDVFHSPDFTLPPTMGKPTLVTVHDLSFMRVPECAYPTLRTYLQEVVPRSVRRASHVLAVSESTRADCVDLLGIEPDRITTVHEGVSLGFRPLGSEDRLPLLARAGIAEPYILAVGTLEPRKNYVRLLQAFSELRVRLPDHRLVIAGRRGWLYEPIFAAVRELGLTDAVSFLQPDDETLAALYSGADAFVAASLYEGFGIPLLEAMACGAPVVCSNVSSFPEIVGDAAEQFDPLFTADIAQAIAGVIDSKARQRTLRDLGFARVTRFSWANAAQDTLDLYRKAVGG